MIKSRCESGAWPSGRFTLNNLSKMKTTFSKIQNLYLSFVNDFLTVDRFAEYYGMSVEVAQKLIDTGRKVHERACYNAFEVHGVYAWSNACGCEVQLNKSGDGARLRFPDSRTMTEWYEIETVENEDFDPETDDESDDFHNVIDPCGHNIPLSLVMRA